MVTRFEAVEIGWKVAKDKGFQPTADFSRGNRNAELNKLIHEVYEDRSLDQSTRSGAERILRDEITIR